MLFDRLNKNPEFLDDARKLVAVDWRTGSGSFGKYVTPLLNEIFAVEGFRASGDLSIVYLERRVMEGLLDPTREPWLWAYANLVGAYVSPVSARMALNGIETGGRA